MKKYESYQASSVGWLGGIPKHWDCLKVGSLFSQRNTKVSDKDYPPLSVTKNGVVPQLATAAKSNDNDNRKLVRIGDFVINSRSDRKGSCGVSDFDGSVSLINIVLEPRQEWNGRYVHYLLRSQPFSEEFYRWGRGIVADLWTTRYSEMKNILLPVPPRAEQDQIVRFLDWKTSRINRLTNTYRKEIDRIIELKSAIISQTVMRGLNPNAKMKNSGINWVGDIPQHWEMVPNKALFRKRHIEVGNSFRDFQLLSLTTSGIREKDISDVKGKVPASYEKYQIVRPNDMVFCLFDLDVSAVFAGVSHYNGMITSAYDTTECNEEYISPKYADYWFQFVFSERYYKMYSKNVRYTISFENFGMIKTPVPPRAEQDQIVEFLDKKASAFQRIIDIQAKRIELLKEYKNRLISDVVTGQIDVRDVEIPEYERVEEIAEAEPENEEAELEEAESEVS